MTMTGGQGGSGGVWSADDGLPWLPRTTLGGTTYSAVAVTPRPGKSGSEFVKSGVSAATWGRFSADAFVPADGTAGDHGEPGEGGSGGSGGGMKGGAQPGTWFGNGGAGGGGGGCPGLAGTVGKGGGASIAALVFGSALRFERSELVSSDGGWGGRGTFGTSPTAGGQPGARIAGLPATAGRAGGDGGPAGIGGAGAGGPSFALAYTGPAPVLTNTTTEPGRGGQGVAADSTLVLTYARNIPASVGGAAEPIHKF